MAEKNLQHSFLFNKNFKIRKSFEYHALNKLKKRVYGNYMNINYRFNANIEYPRLGITVSSKLGKAYKRNNFKRIIREIFRLNIKALPQNLEINVLAKSLNTEINYINLSKDFFNFIKIVKK